MTRDYKEETLVHVIIVHKSVADIQLQEGRKEFAVCYFTPSFGSGTKTINQFEHVRIRTDRVERGGYNDIRKFRAVSCLL